MRKTYLIAAFIALGIGLWLASGQLGGGDPVRHDTLAKQREESAAVQEDRTPTRVQARISQAQSHTASVTIRGRTENQRNVDVRAETQGRIESRPAEKGSRVKAGDLLCKLSADDRNASLTEAREAFNQASIDFEGAKRLKKRGFQSETDIARARARLAAAQANVERANLEINRTYIRAPFDGVVENTQAEVGDYLQSGAICATVIDLDPMLLVGRVSEQNVGNLNVGGEANGTLADGSTLSGELIFIGSQSDSSTRTYAIEIAIPNADYAIRSGLTAEIKAPVAQLQAHLISPALLALDTAGNIGLRTLSDDDVVVWNDVVIVDDAGSGAWVTGLPDVARIITVGQEMVVPGEQVEAVFESAPAAMPASRSTEPDPQSAPSESPSDSAADSRITIPDLLAPAGSIMANSGTATS